MLSHLRIVAASWAAELRPALLHRHFAAARTLGQTNDMVPLSLAMKQLEGVLLDPSLPPDTHAANLAAFTTLRSFVGSLANPHAYPPASIQTLQFAVPDDKQLQRTRVLLKTTGGDCSRLVQETLGQLLERCGLSGSVYFDSGEFNPRLKPRAAQPRRPAPRAAPPSPQEVEQVRAKAAAAGFPSQTITEEQFQELEADQAERRGAKAASANASEALRADLERLAPLLRACAAVPWLPQDEDGLRRGAKIRAEVVDELEAWGWDVRGALVRIWGGERSEAALCKGKEGGTKEATQALLFYAKQNDKEYGMKCFKLLTLNMNIRNGKIVEEKIE